MCRDEEERHPQVHDSGVIERAALATRAEERDAKRGGGVGPVEARGVLVRAHEIPEWVQQGERRDSVKELCRSLGPFGATAREL